MKRTERHCSQFTNVNQSNWHKFLIVTVATGTWGKTFAISLFIRCHRLRCVSIAAAICIYFSHCFFLSLPPAQLFCHSRLARILRVSVWYAYGGWQGNQMMRHGTMTPKPHYYIFFFFFSAAMRSLTSSSHAFRLCRWRRHFDLIQFLFI